MLSLGFSIELQLKKQIAYSDDQKVLRSGSFLKPQEALIVGLASRKRYRPRIVVILFRVLTTKHFNITKSE